MGFMYLQSLYSYKYGTQFPNKIPSFTLVLSKIFHGEPQVRSRAEHLCSGFYSYSGQTGEPAAMAAFSPAMGLGTDVHLGRISFQHSGSAMRVIYRLSKSPFQCTALDSLGSACHILITKFPAA